MQRIIALALRAFTAAVDKLWWTIALGNTSFVDCISEYLLYMTATLVDFPEMFWTCEVGLVWAFNRLRMTRGRSSAPARRGVQGRTTPAPCTSTIPSETKSWLCHCGQAYASLVSTRYGEWVTSHTNSVAKQSRLQFMDVAQLCISLGFI